MDYILTIPMGEYGIHRHIYLRELQDGTCPRYWLQPFMNVIIRIPRTVNVIIRIPRIVYHTSRASPEYFIFDE